MINYQWQIGEFPALWKEARLIMLEKPRKNLNDQASYRPICFLNSMSKLMEITVNERLKKEIEGTGGLADEQCGFRKGRSTTTAMQRVRDIAAHVNSGAYKNREYCIMVSLDVQNAFNSAPWEGILEETRRRDIAPHVIRILCSYQNERSLKVGEQRKLTVISGVPQGSILGPTLWNLYYDGVLRLQMPEGVQVIGYAVDLAVIASAKNAEKLQAITEEAIGQIASWMKKKKLTLAPHKTEAVMLVGCRGILELTAGVEGVEITTAEAIRYLSVVFDRNLRKTEYVRRVTKKGQGIANKLARIMPNQGGPGDSKRRVIASVVYSILLYGAPIWRKATGNGTCVKLLESVYRQLALSRCRWKRERSWKSKMRRSRKVVKRT
jgi:hypothetical protein